jgi:hypothetical protein
MSSLVFDPFMTYDDGQYLGRTYVEDPAHRNDFNNLRMYQADDYRYLLRSLSNNWAIVGAKWFTNGPIPNTTENWLLQFNTNGSSLSPYISARLIWDGVNDGMIEVWDRFTSTLLCASAPGVLQDGQEYRLEFMYKKHSSLGAVDFHVDGVSVCSATNINTTSNGGLGAQAVVVGSGSGTGAPVNNQWRHFFIDIGNNALTVAPDFYGDWTVDIRTARANGDFNELTVFGAPTNYQAVDEILPNDDADYVASLTTTTTLREMYSITSAPTPTMPIKAVNLLPYAKGEAGVIFIVHDYIKRGGVYYTGFNQAFNTPTAYSLGRSIAQVLSPWGVWANSDFDGSTQYGIIMSVLSGAPTNGLRLSRYSIEILRVRASILQPGYALIVG